jgi:hypothetical protein
MVVLSANSALISSMDSLSSLDSFSKKGFLMVKDFTTRRIFLLAKMAFSSIINTQIHQYGVVNFEKFRYLVHGASPLSA